MNYLCNIDSPLGTLLVVSDGENVTELWIDRDKFYASKITKLTEKELPVFEQVKEWMDCYFSGKEPGFIPPLALSGSEFQKTVWKLLLEIPYGTVVTYGEVAKRIEVMSGGAKRMAAQAVGGAVGKNPVSVIVPCHRVVGTNGNLTGYGGGMHNKIKLLEYEHISMDKFHMPTAGKLPKKTRQAGENL